MPQENDTTPAWQDIEQSDKYQGLDYDSRIKVRGGYFDNTVSKNEKYGQADDVKKKEIRDSWMSQEPEVLPIQGERGLVGDVASNVARGGVDLLEHTAQAVKTATGGRYGTEAAEYFKKLPGKVDFLRPDLAESKGEGVVKRGAMGAARSVPLSAAIVPAAIAGAKTGAAVGTLVGPEGTVAGGLIGGVLGAGTAMIALFGAGTYGKQKDEVTEELTKTRPELNESQIDAMAHKNAMSHAKAEVLGETAGDAAAYIIFSRLPGGKIAYKGAKTFLKDLAKPGAARTIAKGLAKDMPFEVGSEVGTAYFQHKADAKIDIAKGTALENMGEAIIPAMFLSGGMGVGVGGYSAFQRKTAYEGINSEDAEVRQNSIDSVMGSIAESTGDKKVAQKWRKAALQYVEAGERVPVDQNFAEFIGEEEVHAKGEEFEDQPVAPIQEEPVATGVPAEEKPKGVIAKAVAKSPGQPAMPEEVGAGIVDESAPGDIRATEREAILGDKVVAASTMEKLVANEQLNPEEEVYRDELILAKKDEVKQQKVAEKKAAIDAGKREEVLRAVGYDTKVLDMSEEEYQELVDSEQKVVADKEAKPEFKADLKAAGELAAEDTNRQAMEQAKAMGGISIDSAKQMFSGDTYKQLSKPGLFTKTGQQVDDVATQLGYESANDLVDAWSKTPLKKEAVAEAVREQRTEFELAEEAERKAPVQVQTTEDFKILADGLRSGEYTMSDEEIESFSSVSVKQKSELLDINNKAIGNFTEQVNAVLKDKKQADAVTSIVKARAVSLGMNPSDYLKTRGIQVVADSKDLGTKEGRQANKGAVDMSKEGQVIIHAFESADVSTMVHELGHVFRRDLSGAEMKAATDWATKDGTWDRVAEEKFARGWEKYITSGKAPNAELKSLFEKFKNWMLGVYKSLTHPDIDIEISPEIIRVFDSLVSGEAVGVRTKPSAGMDALTQYKIKPSKTEKVTNPKSVAYGQEVNIIPSEKQIESENYKKAHVRLDGFDITIENPAGSVRSGSDEKGEKWSVDMKNDYGYFKQTEGFDKDHVDVFFANGYKGGAQKVHVVNQVNSDGSFDEHKVVIGAESRGKARQIYKANYAKGWKGGKSVVEMSMDEFKSWVKSNAPKKGPVSKGDLQDGIRSDDQKLGYRDNGRGAEGSRVATKEDTRGAGSDAHPPKRATKTGTGRRREEEKETQVLGVRGGEDAGRTPKEVRGILSKGELGISPDVLFQQAGIKSKTADTSALYDATQRLESGDSPEQIRQETGWHLGKDKKWRYEIDDSEAEFLYGDEGRGLLYSEGDIGYLPDFIAHQRLYEAYPELRGLNVRVDDMAMRSRGGFIPRSRTIKLNANKSADIQKKTLIHEIQHAIQHIEGFSKGGSAANIKEGEQPVNPMWKKWKNDPIIKEFKKYLTDADYRAQLKLLQDYHKDVYAKKFKDEKDASVKESLNEDYKEYAAVNSPLVLRVYKLIKSKGGDPREPSRLLSPFETYQRLFGEIEARDTAERMNMTAKDRKREVPYVGQGIPMDQAIVRYADEDVREDVREDVLFQGSKKPVNTESPEFKRWFGDSKVVDEEGKPLVVYHGTGAEFEAFDAEKIGETYGVDEIGFFFSSDKDEAQYSADESAYKKEDDLAEGRIIDVYLSLENPLVVVSGVEYEAEFGKGNAVNTLDQNKQSILQDMEDGENDGLIVRGTDGEGDVYMVIEPPQIKSATSNTGAFDPTDPNIFMQAAPLTLEQQDYMDNRAVSGSLKAKTRRNLEAMKDSFSKGVDKYMGAISTRLGDINPKLKAKIRQLDFNIGTNQKEDVEAVVGLLKKARKMSGDDFKDWDYARKNSDKVKIAELVDKYDMRVEYDSYRARLDQLHTEAKGVGLDVGWVDEYAPRVLKDSTGFLRAIGKGDDWPVISRALQKRADELGVSIVKMTPEMKADLVSNMLFGGQYGMGGPPGVKARTVKKIPADLNPYYMDSDSALVSYIHSMRKSIEQRKFFGKVPDNIAKTKASMHRVMASIRAEKDKENPSKRRIGELSDDAKLYRDLLDKYKYSQHDYTENIGQYVLDLVLGGEVSPAQEKALIDIMNARFHEAGTRGIIQAYKNFSYIDTMGNPISALTQIGDLAWAAYASGLGRTLKNAYKSVAKQSRITKEDVGIERVAQEFADSDTLSGIVNKVFKYVGLEKMDSIGKEAMLNSSLEKFEVRAKKYPDKLAKEIEYIFEGQTQDVINDLQNKDITENVKLLVYSELLDYQPAALSEMPEQYLRAGNGRLFYMLKSYTLKQFDVYRNEVYKGLRSGEKEQVLRSMKNLVTLSLFLTIANGGADELKDFVLNRETSFSDRVTDNILRLFGVSKYVTWKARTEGIGSALTKQILPPFKFVDAATKDVWTAGDDKGLYSLNSIPLVGKLAFWHMGRGKDARANLYDRRFSAKKKELKKIEDIVSKNPSKRKRYRKELRDYRKVRNFQKVLNRNRSRLNKLKALESKGKNVEPRLSNLRDRRISIIKDFLEQV